MLFAVLLHQVSNLEQCCAPVVILLQVCVAQHPFLYSTVSWFLKWEEYCISFFHVASIWWVGADYLVRRSSSAAARVRRLPRCLSGRWHQELWF